MKKQIGVLGEQAKIQAPDGYAQDRFGQSIAMDNTLLVVGSPRQDGLEQDAGAAYLYKLKFASVSFSAVRHNKEWALSFLCRNNSSLRRSQ